MPTFADYLSSGSGGAEHSIYIEGCPLAFCTSEAMAGLDADGVMRIGGLKRSGLSISEAVDMPNATLSYSLGSATIEDTSARDPSTPWLRGASSVFSAVPRVVGYLTASVTAIAVVWAVRDASVFTVGQVYHCDTEAIEITARDIGAKTITVTRARLRTSIQAHFVEVASTSGSTTAVCPIYSAPIYRNRRVWIYGHGSSELATTDTGTLITCGMLGANPKMSGQSWQLTLQPRTHALEQEVGSVTEELKPRGIYYAGTSGCGVTVRRYAGADKASGSPVAAYVVMSGFWETQEEFCRALTLKLNTNSTVVSWGTVVFDARPADDGKWDLFFTVLTTARFVDAFIQSGVDGFGTTGDVWFPGVSGAPPAISATVGGVYVASRDPVLDPPASTVYGVTYPYAMDSEGLRGVPRVSCFSDGARGTVAERTASPKNRIYLESVLGINVGDFLAVNESRGEGVAYDAKVTAVDAASRYIEIEDSDAGISGEVGRGVAFQIVPGTNELTLKLVQDFGTATHLGGLIIKLLASAQGGANAGRAPFLTGDDFTNTFAITDAVVAAAAGRPWLLSRSYRFAARVKLSDIIKHEARLYGLFMCTDAEGRIQFRPVTTRTQTDFVIDAGDVIRDEAPRLDMSDAIITGASVASMYDPQEDKWSGGTVDITSVGATAMLRAHKPLDIKPYSNPTGPDPAPYEVFLQVNPTIQLFSSQRGVVTFAAPVTHALRICGDACLLSITQVPYDGQRSIDGGDGGLRAVRGTLIGKRWAINEPCVTLTVMCDSIDVAGYSPTARIVSQSGAGTSWTLTTEASRYGDGVTMDADSFVAGMRVRIVEWDAATPTERTGVVTAQDDEDIGVTLDASWTPGASTWNIIFQPINAANITDAQKRFAAIADADGALQYSGGGTAPARLFAP